MSREKVNDKADFTQGSILGKLIPFMIPILGALVLQAAYGAVDLLVVGRFGTTSGLSAVSTGSQVLNLVTFVITQFAMGITVLIARYIGEKRTQSIGALIGGSVVVFAVMSAVLFVIMIAFSRPIAVLMQAPEEAVSLTSVYVKICGSGIFFIVAYNVLSAIFRGLGDSKSPLIFVAVACVINIAGDLILVAGFRMDAAGAAIATVISQGISAVLCIIYMITKVKEVVPQKEDFAWDSEMMKDLAGQGYAMAFMGSIVSIGSIILQSGINGLGTKIIAGHVAARKVYALMNLPFISIGVALSTFIGQNKGSNQGERILRAMKDAYLFDVVFAAVCSLILWFSAPSLIHLISGSNDPTIIGNGSKFLYVVGPFYAVLGMLMQTRFALQGLGSKILPLFSSVIECVGKILFTMFLIPMFQYDAVIWCEPIIWCLMLIELLISFECNSYIKDVKKQMKLKV